MSGYTDTIFSQGMAAFFAQSKSAVLDNKMRYELVSKSRVLYTKVPLAQAIIKTFTRGVIGSGLHLDPADDVFSLLSSTYSLDASSSQQQCGGEQNRGQCFHWKIPPIFRIMKLYRIIR